MTGGGRQQGDAGDGETGQGRQGWSAPEVATLVVSLVVVAAFAAVALVAEVRQPGPARPVFDVRVDGAPTPDAGRFRVPLAIANVGNGGVEQVSVTASLTVPDASPESITVLLDVLPAGASESAVFVFSHDPTAGTLDAWVESYLVP